MPFILTTSKSVIIALYILMFQDVRLALKGWNCVSACKFQNHQGCVLTPILFSASMDWTSHWVNGPPGLSLIALSEWSHYGLSLTQAARTEIDFDDYSVIFAELAGVLVLNASQWMKPLQHSVPILIKALHITDMRHSSKQESRNSRATTEKNRPRCTLCWWSVWNI